MNRRRSNAQRKCCNFLGIFLVLLTRKVPEVLGIDGPNDYNGSEIFWLPTLDVYPADPQLNPGIRAHEFYNDHGRSIVYGDPIRYDPQMEGDVDTEWQKLEDSRALSEPFEGSPNGMDRVSRKDSFRYGLRQRSIALDDESLGNSMYKTTDFSDDAFPRNPSFWKVTRRLRKNENASVDKLDEHPDENDGDREVRKACVAKIMQLENFLNVCKMAKAMHGIAKEVKRHGVLIKLLSNFNIDRIGFKKFSFSSILSKLTRDLKSSNTQMKKAVDTKKKTMKRPNKQKRKPPRRKPIPPKPAVESEEETSETKA